MKLFIYEHITSGALVTEELPASLAHEGDLMLGAIVQDLADLTQFELTIMRDKRLNPLAIEAQPHCLWIQSDADFATLWQQNLSAQDWFLIIAPETGNTLQTLQQSVLAAGKHYLGSTKEATAITTDKLSCYLTLSQHKLNTPETYSVNQWLTQHFADSKAWVVKPRDGAGCLDTYLFESTAAVKQYLAETPDSQLIIQPFIVGLPASLSLFITEECVHLLSINRQLLHQHEHQFSYTHSEVLTAGQSTLSEQQALELAYAVKQALPGLWGFVGIDLILPIEEDPVLIEINPRLTTSYVNLRSALAYNPARWLGQYLNEQSLKTIPV